MREVKYLIVHHTQSRLMTTPEEVDAWHNARGWSRRIRLSDYGDDPVPEWLKFDANNEAVIHFGYHGLIQGDGTFCPGRPFSVTGAQAAGANSNSIGFTVCGDFEKPVADGGDPAPTPAQLATLVDWLTLKAIEHRLDPAKAIFGHRDVPGGTTRTDCPGARLYVLLTDIRRRVAAAMPANDKE